MCMFQKQQNADENLSDPPTYVASFDLVSWAN